MISEPLVPEKPSWPIWYYFLLPGTAAGFALSALLAYLLVLTDTRVRTPRDISKTLQLPVLGFVPDESDDRMLTGEVETAILSSPASMVAESFRQIRSQIMAQTAHNPVSSIVVASVGPGGGATTVACNLAAAMALNDLRVLLVDANLYRPSLDRLYKGLPKQGLTDAVADPSVIDECIAPHPSLARLHIMGVGTAQGRPSSEIFEGKTFHEVLESLKNKYDLVIFDGAPLNLVADSMALASHVDSVVTVVRAGEVSRGAVSRVRDQMRSVHANLLGFVLNAAQTHNTGYFKENYRTFFRYAGSGARAKSVVS
jgi:capsular exopolysaccharide synthesis family protein